MASLKLREPRICGLGCGAGWLTGILHTPGPTTGVELSENAVKRAAGQYPTAKFLRVDGALREPERGEFDVMVSQEVIERIENKRLHLEVIHLCLRHGEQPLVATPNPEVLNAIPVRDRRAIREVGPVELPRTSKEPIAALQTCGFQAAAGVSLITGCGRTGLERFFNSHKWSSLLDVLRRGSVWQRVFRRTEFGMYPTAIDWER
jgi:hypothetical protein